ncbi:MAG TPA: redoxin domain-containing protein [Pyrinomonadaceae bacterium]|nr:redoxin domain-containing protein [Pyrinomonadaceae bacterium]
MKNFRLFALLAALSCALLLSSLPSARANNADANSVSVGSTVEDFKLPDASGKQHTLKSLAGRNGTVLIFVSVQCPISNAYNARMERYAQELKSKGVNLVGVNSNATESSDDVKRHAAEKGLTFTILKDKDNKLADRLGALVTPEAYFLDASNKLVYRGPIDNDRYNRLDGTPELRPHLLNAVAETLAGKPVTVSETRAFGCSIKRAS